MRKTGNLRNGSYPVAVIKRTSPHEPGARKVGSRVEWIAARLQHDLHTECRCKGSTRQRLLGRLLRRLPVAGAHIRQLAVGGWRAAGAVAEPGRVRS
jgi:hypothetical protein